MVALFPGLTLLRFLIACSMQEWRGEAWEQGYRCSASFTFLALLRSPFSLHLFFSFTYYCLPFSLFLLSVLPCAIFLPHIVKLSSPTMEPRLSIFLFPDSPCAWRKKESKGLGTRLNLVLLPSLSLLAVSDRKLGGNWANMACSANSLPPFDRKWWRTFHTCIRVYG